MLTRFIFRRQIQADVETWVKRGMLGRSSADAILAECRAVPAGNAVSALTFVLVILAAGALIGFAAAGWPLLPREVRVGVLLAVDVALLAACLAATLRLGTEAIATEASAALAVVAAAVSIALIGQMYRVPADWPGFGLSLMMIAGATVMVTRSTACIWLAAVALTLYHVATLADAAGGLSALAQTAPPGALPALGAAHTFVVVGFAAVLLVLAVSGWTAHSGPGTLFVVLVPMVWATAGAGLGPGGLVPGAIGWPLAWICGAILVLSVMVRESELWPRLWDWVPPERLAARVGALVSALLGLVAVACLLIAAQDVGLPVSGAGGSRPQLGALPIQSVIVVGLAVAAIVATLVRPYEDKSALIWLAVVVAVPFVADIVLARTDGEVARAASAAVQLRPAWRDLLRLALLVVVPLTLLAVAAQNAGRHKTFAFSILALLAIVGYQLWSSKNLLMLAGGLLVTALVVLAGLALARFVPSLVSSVAMRRLRAQEAA